MKTISLMAVLVGGTFLMTSNAHAVYELSTYQIGKAATVKINGLFQGWTIQNQHTTSKDQHFRIRRAELRLTGSIADAPKYFFMIDPSRLIPPPGGKSPTADVMLQDFGMSYAFPIGLEITAGQFRTPTTAEGLDSSTDLPLAERSLPARIYGDRREMGMRVAYRAEKWNVSSMLSSGRSLSEDGRGMFNDLHTRVEVKPLKGLGLGSFVTMGKKFSYSAKGRWGINARYELGDAGLRVEYAQGKDAAVQSHGFVTEASYWITPNLQPVARYENYRANQGASSSAQAETIGLNYYLRDYNAKLQLDASMMQHMAAVNGTPAVSSSGDNETVTLVVQASI